MAVPVIPNGPIFEAFAEQGTEGANESSVFAITEKTAATPKTAFLTQKRGSHMDLSKYRRICHAPRECRALVAPWNLAPQPDRMKAVMIGVTR